MFFRNFLLLFILIHTTCRASSSTDPTPKSILNVMSYMGVLDHELISKFEKENSVAVRVEFIVDPFEFESRMKSHLRMYDAIIADESILEKLQLGHFSYASTPLFLDPLGVAYDSTVSKIPSPFLWNNLIEPDKNPYWRQRIVTTGPNKKQQLMLALFSTKTKITSFTAKLPENAKIWLEELKLQSVNIDYPLELAFLGNKISAAVVFYSNYLKIKKVVPHLEFAVPYDGTFCNRISVAQAASSFQENLTKKFIQFLAAHKKELTQKNHFLNLNTGVFKGSQTRNWVLYDEYQFIQRQSDLKSP